MRLVEAPAQYGNAAQFGVRGTSAPLSLSDAQAIAARYGAGIAYETRSGNYRTGEHHINPTRVCFTLEQLGALLADGHGVMVNEGGQKNG